MKRLAARIERTTGIGLAAAALLAIATPATAQGYPDGWYYYGSGRPASLRGMEGKPAPELKLKEWIGEPQRLEDLRGNVVVIDFWGTWCPPCMRALPKNVKLAEDYAEKGLVVIGVHDARRGWERMARVAEQLKINYPLAVDDGGASTAAWNVSFWPTYAVVDRTGVVRAIGLSPDKLEPVVQHVLNEDAAPAPKPDADAADEPSIPDAWYEGSPARRLELKERAGTDPPPIESDTWLNTDPIGLDELQGRVVVLDFWATWCGPCIKSIPKMNDLQTRYGAEGLTIIGVCHPQAVSRMGAIAEKHGIEYPICADASGAIVGQYQVNGYPDYYLIDRSGKLRIADCRNDRLEAAIRLLLEEQ